MVLTGGLKIPYRFNEKTFFFCQNSLLLFNIVAFKSDTTIITVFKFFDTLPVVILRLVLKIGFSFGDDFFVGVKFFSGEHSLKVREEEKVAWGKVWRIRWMGEQIEAQFMQFRHRFHGLVARRIVLVKQDFFLLHLWSFLGDFGLQTLQ